MYTRTIDLEKGRIFINYLDEQEMAEFYGTQPITITFVPLGEMKPEDGLSYANEYSDEAVKEAKKIVAEFPDFYKGWEIRFSNQFTGYRGSRHDILTHKITAREVSMNVFCKKLEDVKMKQD